MLEYHINWILASFYYCYCQNSNFVCPFSPKGKHSVKGHKAVLSSKCFIKQTKVGCREGEGEQVVWKPKTSLLRNEESRLTPNKNHYYSGKWVDFLEWWKVPPGILCHLTDKLIDSFRLYNWSWVPVWNSQRGKNSNANLLQM